MVELYYRIIDLFRSTYTARIISSFFELLLLIGPYFLVSVLLNAIIRRYFTNTKFLRVSRNEIVTIVIAGLVGIVSPLPTYIAVPLGISLMNTGIPFSAIAAFMVSSPLMNPGIFYLTLMQLGLEITIARVVSAYLLALGAGFLTKLIWKKIHKKPDFDTKKQIPEPRPLWIEFKRSVTFLGKYFIIAIFLGAAVKALVPAELISRMLGGNANMSLVLAIAMGVPFYSCGGAAIPLMQVLSEMGMNKGAVLAFFIAGPATKLETMYVYKSVLGLRVLLLYLAFTLIGAFLCGFILLKL